MPTHPQTTQARRTTRSTLLLALGAAAALLLAAPASAAPAVISVVFTADDMGFTATSSKDVSNVIVVLCDGTQHKHEPVIESHVFVHTETQEITGVYVKSGDNGIEGNIPPGAGEFFANAGVDCSETSTSTSSTDTSTSSTDTSTSSTDTSTSSTDTSTSSTNTTTEPDIPTEEVPFFGAPLTIGLGLVGAAGGALLMLRRRL